MKFNVNVRMGCTLYCVYVILDESLIVRHLVVILRHLSAVQVREKQKVCLSVSNGV